MKSPTIPTTYASLRRQVEETLLLGQRQIEQAKIQTYWQTGRLINEHVLVNKTGNAQYGENVIGRLAEDLGVGPQLLWRCVRFSRAFRDFTALEGAAPPNKKVSGRTLSLSGQLKWSHYRELIKVEDEDQRRSFLQRAKEKNWNADQLAAKIRLETGREPGEGAQASRSLKSKTEIPRPLQLKSKRGKLYTYRLIAADSLHAKDDARPWIDLGFQVHRALGTVPRPQAAGTVPKAVKTVPSLKSDTIIESKRQGSAYCAVPSTRTESDLFTYKAFVERVVDADTLLVRIDLGFDTRIRQYVRLRAIDAPELSTPEGKRAAAFVKRELSKADHIILRSSRSDKYDRYLGDVFYSRGQTPSGSDPYIFLNQRLLDEGLARKV